MDHATMNTVLWLVAGVLLVLYVARRRKRKLIR